MGFLQSWPCHGGRHRAGVRPARGPGARDAVRPRRRRARRSRPGDRRIGRQLPSYVAGALAREGIAALSAACFGRPGLPPQLRGIPLEYFADTLQILRAAVPSPRVPAAVAGLSRGSEAAMLTAICAPEAVQGVVAAVPANVIAGSHPPGGPAWLRHGHPLPYADPQDPGDQNPDALIPVEQVRGPVLLIAAGADQVCPPPAAAAVGRYSPARPSHSPGAELPASRHPAQRRPEPARDPIHGTASRDGRAQRPSCSSPRWLITACAPGAPACPQAARDARGDRHGVERRRHVYLE
jgi:dienelactone hydrolase